MEYLECLEDCHFDADNGGERCFTRGSRYQILEGSTDNMRGVLLMNDQGGEHTISGLWASRFVALNVPLPLTEFFERIVASPKRERIDEGLLWDTPEKPKLFEWTTTSVNIVPARQQPTSWVSVPVDNRPRDDNF